MRGEGRSRAGVLQGARGLHLPSTHSHLQSFCSLKAIQPNVIICTNTQASMHTNKHTHTHTHTHTRTHTHTQSEDAQNFLYTTEIFKILTCSEQQPGLRGRSRLVMRCCFLMKRLLKEECMKRRLISLT